MFTLPAPPALLFLVKDYLARREHVRKLKTPAQVLLDLAGSWEDNREAEQIIAEIKSARKSSEKLSAGF